MGAGTGTLYVVATPIGNLADLSDRCRGVLGEVALVAAEDTRTTGRLLARLGISVRILSVFEGNEHARRAAILRALREGSSVALVSECGTPAVSDPGALLVDACHGAGIPVVPVPGPSALTAALSASGFPGDRFRFEGFLPKKGSVRRARIHALRTETAPTVLYESPARVVRTLAELAEALGARRVLVARELTKRHEEIVRGPLPEIAAQVAAGPTRGEYTLVVEGGAEQAPRWSEAEVIASVERLLRDGLSTREVVDALAAPSGWSRRQLYARVTRLREG